MQRSIAISLKLALIAFLVALLFNLFTGKQQDTEPQQNHLSSRN